MPLTKSYVNKNHKWNWNLAFMLYCGGMPLSAILANENFKGLTYNTLVCKANTDNWYGQKGELEEKAYNHGAKELADRIAEAKVQHQQFMLDQIEEERDAILQDFKFPGSKMRKERLDALRTLDEIARKNLGLDDEKLITHEEKIFGMLISLQKQPPKQIEATLVTRPLTLTKEPMIENKIEQKSESTEPEAKSEPEWTTLQDLDGNKTVFCRYKSKPEITVFLPYNEVFETVGGEERLLTMLADRVKTVHETNGNESKRTSLAASPLLDNKNATTGIVSSLNAIPEVDKTPEMQSDEEKEPTQGEWKPNLPNPVAVLHRREDGTEEYELQPSAGKIVVGEALKDNEEELELERIAKQDLENQANEDLRNLAEQILERPRGLKTLKPLIV